MSVQRFLNLEDALELLNILDSEKSKIEIDVLPDISELFDEEVDVNEVNTKTFDDVDPQDWLAELHSIKIRRIKWYYTVLIRSLDVAMVNAWIIHKILYKDEV
ncbi:hypothetical protein TNCV_4764381 [Trichonephila clavipes]|nr:hypothetical protein TNCV_4764381 [Trichonephila clavipes]